MFNVARGHNLLGFQWLIQGTELIAFKLLKKLIKLNKIKYMLL